MNLFYLLYSIRSAIFFYRESFVIEICDLMAHNDHRPIKGVVCWHKAFAL
jgi:hypothetical protein